MRGKVEETSAPDPAMAATMEFAAVADTIAAPLLHRSPSPAEMAATIAAPPAESNARREGAATIGRFLLLRKLGEGGMGEVFSGYDEQLDRKVAIKLLHAAYAPEETQKRMLREAQALARLSHPNVVAVHEVGQIEGDVFVVMEHIDGQTLRDWQDEGPRSVDEILRAYVMAGRGLAAVHAAGMVHRDFKPHNVMIDRQGRVRLLDFGLAHARGMLAPTADTTTTNTPNNLASQLTAEGAIAGTPAYMSPEQFAGTPLDARSDQFSFCIALHEALYQKLPTRKDSGSASSCPGLAASLARPSAHNDIPPRIVDALERGWSREPEQRFPSMNELLEALEVPAHADPSGQARQRLVFALLLLALMGAWSLAPAGWFETSNLPRTTLLVALSALLVGGAGTYFFRNTLFKNPFHRIRIIFFLVMGAAIAVSRLIGVLHHETIESVVVRDICLTVLGVTMVTLLLVPRVLATWITLAMGMCGLAVTALYPQYLGEAAMLTLNGTVIGLFIAWHRSARITPKSTSNRSDVVGSTQ